MTVFFIGKFRPQDKEMTEFYNLIRVFTRGDSFTIFSTKTTATRLRHTNEEIP